MNPNMSSENGYLVHLTAAEKAVHEAVKASEERGVADFHVARKAGDDLHYLSQVAASLGDEKRAEELAMKSFGYHPKSLRNIPVHVGPEGEIGFGDRMHDIPKSSLERLRLYAEATRPHISRFGTYLQPDI